MLDYSAGVRSLRNTSMAASVQNRALRYRKYILFCPFYGELLHILFSKIKIDIDFVNRDDANRLSLNNRHVLCGNPLFYVYVLPEDECFAK